MTEYKNNVGGPGLAVVVLACGESRRFRDAGYSTPKQFLTFDFDGMQDAMLMQTYRHLRTPYINYVVGLEAHEKYLHSVFPRINSFAVPSSRGQAQTMLYAAENLHLSSYHDILFLNCDAGFGPGVLDQLVAHGRETRRFTIGTMYVRGEKDRWSFVDNHPLCSFVYEKMDLQGTSMATTGAYYVPARCLPQLREALTGVCELPDEPYVSYAISRLNFLKESFACDPSEFYDWGTPEAFQSFTKDSNE